MGGDMNTPINKPPYVTQELWDASSPAERRFLAWHEAMHSLHASNDNDMKRSFNIAMDSIVEQMLAEAGIPVEPCLTTEEVFGFLLKHEGSDET